MLGELETRDTTVTAAIAVLLDLSYFSQKALKISKMYVQYFKYFVQVILLHNHLVEANIYRMLCHVVAVVSSRLISNSSSNHDHVNSSTSFAELYLKPCMLFTCVFIHFT